jgi:hypothetical protein
MEDFFEKASRDSDQNQNQTELFNVEPLAEVPNEKEEEVPVGASCEFCKTRLDLSDEKTHHEVISWVYGKKRDSAVLRQYTGKVACEPCIRVLKTGVDPRERTALELVDDASVSMTIGDNTLFTDRSPVYAHGFTAGLAGNPDGLDPEMMDPNWKEGFVAGQEQRAAQEWVGGPSTSSK